MSAERTGPSRRITLAWMLAAASSPVALSGCGQKPAATTPAETKPVETAGWRDLELPPVKGPGYGGDPDLTDPSAPWPLTMKPGEREIARITADLIAPADEVSPGAGAIGVDAFIDEWVSAPYPSQQEDRALILSGLAWFDAESRRRFKNSFAAISEAERREILDDIAFKDRIKPGYDQPAAFFSRLRALVLAGFYTSPEGVADIGYIGNTPIVGDYPGPTPEALEHLRAALANLGLPSSAE